MIDEKDLSLMAANGRRPETMTAPEMCCWTTLRYIYAAHKAGMISTEYAAKEKAAALQQYRVWDNAFNQHWNDCVELQARNHISSEWVNKLHKGLKANEPDRKLMAMACYCLGIVLQDRPLADIASDILAMEE